jgi:hypothetical protein
MVRDDQRHTDSEALCAVRVLDELAKSRGRVNK